MIIAQQKRKENIAEYILYMWQLEDLLRALEFNIEKVKLHLVNQFDQPEKVKQEMVLWYENVIEMMQQEGIHEKGHIRAVFNLVLDLYDVHKYLLKTPSEGKYQQLFRAVEKDIADLRLAQFASEANEIEVCLNFLYGVLLLRVKKKELSAGTKETLKKISALLACLSQKHKDIDDGKIELDI